jgi:hypothetical protein
VTVPDYQPLTLPVLSVSTNEEVRFGDSVDRLAAPALFQAFEHHHAAGQVDLPGVRARASEMRQPVACSVPQKVRTSRGALAAAARKARRSSSVQERRRPSASKNCMPCWGWLRPFTRISYHDARGVATLRPEFRPAATAEAASPAGS